MTQRGGVHIGLPPFFFPKPTFPTAGFSPLTKLRPFQMSGIFQN